MSERKPREINSAEEFYKYAMDFNTSMLSAAAEFSSLWGKQAALYSKDFSKALNALNRNPDRAAVILDELNEINLESIHEMRKILSKTAKAFASEIESSKQKRTSKRTTAARRKAPLKKRTTVQRRASVRRKAKRVGRVKG